jgi:glycosyltransferase involved in cell wall biosynthesis
VRIALLAPLVTAICPSEAPQLGGSQALVADLAQGLAARGHDVELFAASGSQVPGVTVVDTGVDSADLEATLFRHGSSPPEPHLGTWAFERALRRIAGGHFDIVHNHAFDPPAVALAPALGIPTVHTLHLPPDPAVVRALRAACAGPAPPAVVAVSRSQARDWARLVTVDAVLPNGVAVERIPWSAGAGRDLLFVGRLSPEKGAVEAVAIAQAAGMRLVLVGADYDPGYARTLRASCRTADVDLRGALGRHEVWRLMAASRALLCPIRWDEPFGLAAAEAQAAGTPVVAFDRGALRDIVCDGRTGWIVPEGDVGAAAAAARSASHLSRAEVRRHAERNLSLERTLDAHEALYDRIVGSARSDRAAATGRGQ